VFGGADNRPIPGGETIGYKHGPIHEAGNRQDTGPGATLYIWQNDVDAMAGKRSGGWAAPVVLNYMPGINKVNRPQAMVYANLIGVTAVPGVSSIDEYPFASTAEGGARPYLHVAAVPIAEQDRQRDQLRAFYAPGGFKGFRFLVVPLP
jgi:hypothetical protein